MQTATLVAAPSVPSVKHALCIERRDAPLAFREATELCAVGLRSDFFATPTRLIDRAICESDESTLQLIPYITLVRVKTREIFCYYRGAAGNEARLHSKLSIGLGGHVDLAPASQSEFSLRCLLEDEGKRELREEASVEYIGDLGFDALLCDPMDAVGRVHIGLLSIAHLTEREIDGIRPEVGVVERGTWMTLDALREPNTFARLEPWSRVALSVLND